MSACFELYNSDNLAKKRVFSAGFGGIWRGVETVRGLVYDVAGNRSGSGETG
jgi:hypothetical protein